MLNWFWSENRADEPKMVPMKPDPEDAVRTAAFLKREADALKARQAIRDHKENIRAEARILAANQPEICEASTHKKDSRERVFANHNHKDVIAIKEEMQQAQIKWPTKGKMAMFKHADTKAVVEKTKALTEELQRCTAWHFTV